ncbi:hypothetical protein BGW41_006022 [Actinomortierella wolfii]|nr:hypothetical protein BGW41_006022 [Actinomortierella wolfii]
MTRYIPAEYRANLSKYKYSGVDESLLSKYVLGPYWNKLVTFFPITMAPNKITGMGFLLVVFNMLTMLYFAPDMEAACPNWAYFTFGVGLFVYQSFDAIDGKQARRTGTSGPLGELFDHALANFYLTTWEEYHTGTLYLSAFSGPVEGIIMIVILYFITAITGPQFWLHTFQDFVPALPAIQINHFLIAFGTVSLLGNILTAFQHVIKARQDKRQPVLPALMGLLPYVGMSFVAYFWLNASPHIVTQHAVPWVLYVGLSFGYTVGLMITAHVTHQPFPMFNVSFVPLIFGALHANLPLLGFERLFGTHLEDMYLWGCLAFSAVAYAHFAVVVVNDICDYFDIWCFTIKHPKKAQ